MTCPASLMPWAELSGPPTGPRSVTRYSAQALPGPSRNRGRLRKPATSRLGTRHLLNQLSQTPLGLRQGWRVLGWGDEVERVDVQGIRLWPELASGRRQYRLTPPSRQALLTQRRGAR